MVRSIQKTALMVTVAVTVCAIAAAAQIPSIRITTRNNAMPAAGRAGRCSGYDSCAVSVAGGGVFSYIQMTRFELTVPGSSDLMNVTKSGEPDSIRRRGNSTSTASKIPYRIKFDKKTSFFGKEAARSWVLLANYYDPTFIHNAVAFELGRRLGLEYINSFQHVQLYINNEYRGIYLLTEQVQANPGRVDIDEKDGWLVEFDFHTPDNTECDNWFRVVDNRRGDYCVTGFIKSPEDLPAAGYKFVKDDISAFVNAVGQGGTAWRDLIDFESFAKSILIIQAMQNVDFNRLGSNFAYKDTYHKRMYAGPLWDFDLCCGMPSTFEEIGPGGCRFPTRYCVTEKAMKPQNDFYGRIWDDPAFRSRVKKVWDRHRADFDAIPAFMDSMATVLSGADFSRDGSGRCGSTPCASSASAHRTEINKFKTWWTARMTNVNQQLSGFSTSNDITQPVETKPATSADARRVPTNAGSRVTAVRNGIGLSVVDKAVVKVYGLDGRQLRRVNLTRGNHSLRMGDLPSGMYMVRVSMDGETRMLRVPVR